MQVSRSPSGHDIPDGARVRAAAVALELGDQLHRPHLRRARHGPGREAGLEQLERADAGAQVAGHFGDEVRDVREALGHEEPLDAHRPGEARPREVVAAEVDEHHVLGAVLRGREQRLGVALAARHRARDRVQARAAALQLHERLRRRADKRHVAELQQEEVRRRVHAPQRPVERHRARRGRPLRALREHDLEDIACADVLLGPQHARLVGLAVRKAARGRRCGRHGRRDGRRLAQARGELVGVAAQHLGDPERVVEAHERLGGDEPARRQVRPVVGHRHRRLELRDLLVAEEPDGRPVERGELLEGDEPRA